MTLSVPRLDYSFVRSRQRACKIDIFCRVIKYVVVCIFCTCLHFLLVKLTVSVFHWHCWHICWLHGILLCFFHHWSFCFLGIIFLALLCFLSRTVFTLLSCEAGWITLRVGANRWSIATCCRTLALLSFSTTRHCQCCCVPFTACLTDRRLILSKKLSSSMISPISVSSTNAA